MLDADEDDANYSEHWKKLKKLKGKGQPRQPGGSYAKPRQHIVTHYNATTQALIRRKVKVLDKDALYHVKVSSSHTILSMVSMLQASGIACSQHTVTHNSATTQALTRRKVKVLDKDALYLVKVREKQQLNVLVYGQLAWCTQYICCNFLIDTQA